MKRINLAAPKMVGNERKYVAEAFDSNWVAPLGPFVARLERNISDYIRVEGSVAVASGTAAIHLALLECGVTNGDVVFCSDMTFTASANPIRYCGAEPVFIDCESTTYGMSPESLKKAFQKYKPKAVVVASIYGIPAKLEELAKICEANGVPMIEDSSEVLGTTLNGKAAGTFGKYGAFSFNGNKIITTSGGGMLVSNDTNSLTHALHIATQAKDSSRYYEHSELGYNYRLSNISAAIGVAQLEKINELISIKKNIYDRYNEAFLEYADYGIKMMRIPEGVRSNYWLSILILENESYTDPIQVIDVLAKQNIEARHIWKPLHSQQLWNGCDFVKTDPEACSDYFFRHGVCLPSDTNMTETEQNTVISIVKELIDYNLRLFYQQGY